MTILAEVSGSRTARTHPILLRIPAKLRNRFEPCLVGDESEEEYFAAFAAFAEVLHPSNAIEWFYLKDFTDLWHEAARYQRWKNVLVLAARRTVAKNMLRDRLDDGKHSDAELAGQADLLVNGNDVDVERRVEVYLGSQGITSDEIAAESFAHRNESYEQLTRMQERAERYRHELVRNMQVSRLVMRALARSAQQMMPRPAADYCD
jgi:hypothetical protein